MFRGLVVQGVKAILQESHFLIHLFKLHLSMIGNLILNVCNHLVLDFRAEAKDIAYHLVRYFIVFSPLRWAG